MTIGYFGLNEIIQLRYNLRVASPLQKGYDEVAIMDFYAAIFNTIRLNKIVNSHKKQCKIINE